MDECLRILLSSFRTRNSGTYLICTAVDFDDDEEEPDEVAAFLPIFLPIDRNYESKYLFQFVDKRRSRVKKRTLQEGQSELPGVGINKVAGKPELRTFGVNRN